MNYVVKPVVKYWDMNPMQMSEDHEEIYVIPINDKVHALHPKSISYLYTDEACYGLCKLYLLLHNSDMER